MNRTCLTTESLQSQNERERYENNKRIRNEYERRRSKSVDYKIQRPQHGLRSPKNITISSKYEEKRAEALGQYIDMQVAKGKLPPHQNHFKERKTYNLHQPPEPCTTTNKVIRLGDQMPIERNGKKSQMKIYIALAVFCILIAVIIGGILFTVFGTGKKKKNDVKCTLEGLGLLNGTRLWEHDGDEWKIEQGDDKKEFLLVKSEDQIDQRVVKLGESDPNSNDECEGTAIWQIDTDDFGQGEFSMKIDGDKDEFDLIIPEKEGEKKRTMTFKKKRRDRRRIMIESTATTATYFSFQCIVILIVILIATVYWHQR